MTNLQSSLVLAGTGGLLFIPAAYVMTYSVLLTALFTLAAGAGPWSLTP